MKKAFTVFVYHHNTSILTIAHFRKGKTNASLKYQVEYFSKYYFGKSETPQVWPVHLGGSARGEKEGVEEWIFHVK